ncbi:hypothetical protein SAMN05421770_101372 [Granulicella rosea]|uniref:Uncharacterized protein n=1 Tax=Granulicella rosea TaxID=474952 RepID=A0A239DBV3_9BACT|nr:hypothetical protein [Granulicella rosea]SNS29341.1 hypothetical protein SAMN05421770_101372 [Granulicella rosea]
MRKIIFVLGPSFAVWTVAALGQAPSPDGSNWRRLQQLPPHTKIHLSADRGGRTCTIDQVDEEQIACSHSGITGRHSYTYARSEVKSVKLAHYLRSSFTGLAAGGAIGLVAGVASAHGPQCNNNSPGFCLNIVSNGTVWTVTTVLGAVVGTAIAGPTDITRGSAIYRRP